jgi:hypothetical protein
MAEPDLATLQRWMYAAVTSPDLSDGDVVVNEVVARSDHLSAAERLAVYRRGYRQRLVECMREMHPASRHVLGDEVFDAFALDYLAGHPPAGYTLFRVDDGFADYLSETRPDRDAPAEQRYGWADLLVDLARLERAWLDVYDGPGTEGTIALSPADLLDGDDVAVVLAPCLRLLEASHPVAGYLDAVRRGADPELPRPRATRYVLSRRDYVVTVTELDEPAFALLATLRAGAHLGAAAVGAGVSLHTARAWLREWADRGWLMSVHRHLEPVPTKELTT